MELTKKCPSCKVVKPHSEYFIQHCRGGKPGVYCKPCSQEKSRAPNIRFTHQRTRAAKRGYEWSLTLEQFTSFISKHCHYCGGGLPKTGGSLDRIDPDKGYTLENSVPACGLCNWVRYRTFSTYEMTILGRAIAEIRALRGLKPGEELKTYNQLIKKRKTYRTKASKEKLRLA
jgi:hypothetical protein